MADTNDSSGGGQAGPKLPLTTFLWAVKLDEMDIDSLAQTASPTALFLRCSGLKFERTVTDYQEGGEQGFVHKMVGALKWQNIVLERGFSGDRAFFDWRANPVRRGGMLMQLADSLQPVVKYRITNMCPVKWKMSANDATKNEHLIETIEIAHEGLELVE
jgi:phage tail-like protein